MLRCQQHKLTGLSDFAFRIQSYYRSASLIARHGISATISTGDGVRLSQFAIVLVSVSGLHQSSVLAQSQAFEVASIKPSGPGSVRGSDGGPGSDDPGRYTFNAASLEDLIQIAWDVRPFQISSPSSLERPNFDLVANVPPGTTKQLFRVMLQNLLAERFGLKVHTDSREFPAYELVVAKSGSKLKEAISGEPRQDPGWPKLPPGLPNIAAGLSVVGGFEVVRLRAQFEPLSVLAGFLRTPDNLPVVDKTGLTGKYSFMLEYTRDIPGGAPDAPPVAPALSSALQQQLGLQLVFRKLPFDVVVVESFNKLPTEN